jgi:hypothetical protein
MTTTTQTVFTAGIITTDIIAEYARTIAYGTALPYGLSDYELDSRRMGIIARVIGEENRSAAIATSDSIASAVLRDAKVSAAEAASEHHNNVPTGVFNTQNASLRRLSFGTPMYTVFEAVCEVRGLWNELPVKNRISFVEYANKAIDTRNASGPVKGVFEKIVKNYEFIRNHIKTVVGKNPTASRSLALKSAMMKI